MMWVLLLLVGSIAILVALFFAILRGVGKQPVWEKLADDKPGAPGPGQSALGDMEQILLDPDAVEDRTTANQSYGAHLGEETRNVAGAVAHPSAN